MTVLLRDGTSSTRTPVRLRAALEIDVELMPLRMVNDRINDLSPLGPERHFREKMMWGAKEFVFRMKQQGKTLLTPEGDMLIQGPYLKHNWANHRDGVRAVARKVDEVLYPDGVTYYIIGTFLETRAHQVELLQRDEDR